MDSFFKDLRASVVLLAKTPGFTLAAIAVLSVGIGLNTAMFGLVHAIVFSPRPYPEPERIVQLYTHGRKDPGNSRAFSYPVYRQIAGRSDLFQGVMAHSPSLVGIGEGEGTRRSFSAIVSSNYFDVLGVRLARGRGFTAEEERPGSEIAVAVASYDHWKRAGFDPGLIGKTVRVNERPFTIVGITPEDFTGTMMLIGPELYFPLGSFNSLTNDFQDEAKRALERADSYNLFLVGRLQSGVSRESAGQAMEALGLAIEKEFPVEQKDRTFKIGELPRLSTSTSPSDEGPLAVVGVTLMAMTGAVLLIVCLNLASMLLARGNARRKEFAIRAALGGSRIRLVRQLLTEGFLLSLIGGALGAILSVWSTTMILNSVAGRVPISIFFSGGPSGIGVVAALLFSVLSTLLFALGPALRQSRPDIVSELKKHAGEDASIGRRRWLPRHPLVIAQIALSLGLLIAAGLFLRMAQSAASTELGFKADDTVVVEVDGSFAGFNETQSLDIYSRTLERLASLPGVETAGIGALIPFGMVSIGRSVQQAGNWPELGTTPASAESGLAFGAAWNAVTSDYFSTMGIPLKAGRTFSAAESSLKGTPAVAIVDERLARKLWPGGNAIGQRIQWAERDAPRERSASEPQSGSINERAAEAVDRTMEVVGIAGSTRSGILDKETGTSVYVPFAQGFVSNAHFHIRPATHSEAAARNLIEPVRSEIRAAAPILPVFRFGTFKDHMNASMGFWIVRSGSTLFVLFGSLAGLVAVVGIYGVQAYAVARRSREIGVRMAIGARPGMVRAMILREGLAMTLTGVAFGLVLGLVVGRLLKGIFVDVLAFDPFAFSVAPLLFVLASMAACWPSARRATRIDPVRALNRE